MKSIASRKTGETISDYVLAIKHLASSCYFSAFLKYALRDKLISGISTECIRQQLLSEEKGFDDTYAMAVRLEQAGKQANILQIQKTCPASWRGCKDSC